MGSGLAKSHQWGQVLRIKVLVCGLSDLVTREVMETIQLTERGPVKFSDDSLVETMFCRIGHRSEVPTAAAR